MENEAKDNDNVVGAMSIEEAVSRLKTPRRLMLMVKAGRPVDLFIQVGSPLLARCLRCDVVGCSYALHRKGWVSLPAL